MLNEWHERGGDAAVENEWILLFNRARKNVSVCSSLKQIPKTMWSRRLQTGVSSSSMCFHFRFLHDVTHIVIITIIKRSWALPGSKFLNQCRCCLKAILMIPSGKWSCVLGYILVWSLFWMSESYNVEWRRSNVEKAGILDVVQEGRSQLLAYPISGSTLCLHFSLSLSLASRPLEFYRVC